MFVFTSCTNNYIPKARILASSLKSFHPNWTFCLLLGEAPPQGFALENEPFDRLVTFDQLPIPKYPGWLFRHRVVEVCTAAKGPALFHFLAREKHDKVMYIDPDIMVCNTLSPLETMLDGHDILLTPHQLAPQETPRSVEDNERVALKYGVFNLGFAAAARRGDGLRFARWWRDRLLEYCYDDIPNGLFTDQRWCDLAPAFFPNLGIVRDPGCNAASWNLTDRTITRAADGTFLANGGPLRFYHFTGFDSGAGDGMTARYAKNMPAVHELWAIYREKLAASGQEELGKLRWAHMTFDDGTPITDTMRLVYRGREDLRRAFPDPFDSRGFLHWFRTEFEAPRHTPEARLSSIRRKVARVMAENGGFPRGLPGLVRHSLARVRERGLFGLARKLWRNEPAAPPHTEKLPLLGDILANPQSPAGRIFFRLLDPSRDVVCVIEHDWGGGAAVYCHKRVTELLDRGGAVARLRYVHGAGRVELTACLGGEGFRCEVDNLDALADSRFPRIKDLIVNELAGWYYAADDLSGAASRLLEAVRAVTRAARSHGARVEVLFHDYFAVCPQINLLTPEGRFCGLGETARDCDACALRGEPFSMREWRTVFGELLGLADEAVFFSEDTRDRVLSVYPLREAQVRLRPHEMEPLGGTVRIPADGPMRVAVVGNIQAHKGADIVVALARILDERMPEASIVVFGDLERECIAGNLAVLGSYNRDDLFLLLEKHGVTAALFPSVWPETFSFVTRELALAGLPIVCFDIGAPAAFVRTLPGSRVAPEISAEAAYAALCELDAARLAGLGEAQSIISKTG